MVDNIVRRKSRDVSCHVVSCYVNDIVRRDCRVVSRRLMLTTCHAQSVVPCHVNNMSRRGCRVVSCLVVQHHVTQKLPCHVMSGHAVS